MEKKIIISEFFREKELDTLWLKRLSFTSVMISSNLLQTMFTKTQQDLTSKQWLLLVITSSLPEPPTLSVLGQAMGCSRQNVKQIAEVLLRKEFVTFTKIDGDKNAIRIEPTEKWFNYAKETDAYTLGILEDIFQGFSKEELEIFFQCFSKMIDNIEAVNDKIKDVKINQ